MASWPGLFMITGVWLELMSFGWIIRFEEGG
ncbi:hypothetical protein COLO4_36288 [Corchorus olitorius]|uniref:Uncharacterized protein n=1 Tax=Corchorus olitorius TaxID=93759 RepID=A0A1R3GA64_9ROSI|nr:hypothetical protein COLO4_36288 [Corchorus olitorius]